MKTKLLLLLPFLLILGGCPGKPSESEIEKLFLDQQANNAFNNYYEIDNFSKTNGIEQGENTYIAEVTYDIVFKKSSDDIRNELGPWNSMKLLVLAGIGIFPKGFRNNLSGNLTLVRSENGWILK